MKINSVVNCIVIPCYWMISTKNEFRDFWSIETCFWKTKRLSHLQSNELQMVPLEPRRPPYQENTFTYERTQPQDFATTRKFFYGMKINKKWTSMIKI